MSPLLSFFIGVILIPLMASAGEDSNLPKGLLDACDRRPQNVEKLERHFKGSKSSISSCVEAQRKAVASCNQEPEDVPSSTKGEEDGDSGGGAHKAAVRTKEAATKARDAHLGRTDVCQKAREEAKEVCEQNFEEVSNKQQEASHRYDALQKEFFSKQQQGQFDADLQKKVLDAGREKAEFDDGRKMIRNSRNYFESGTGDGEKCQVAQARIYHDAVQQADLVAASAASDAGSTAIQGAANKGAEKARDAMIEKTAGKSADAFEKVFEKNAQGVAKGAAPAAGLGLSSDPLDAAISATEEAAKFVVRDGVKVTGVGTFVSAVTSSSPTSSCDVVFSGPVSAYRQNCNFFFMQSVSSAEINERAIKVLESP